MRNYCHLLLNKIIMKKFITIFLVLFAFMAKAQMDSTIHYDSLPVFSIGVDIPYGINDTLKAPVIVWKNYDCFEKDGNVWHVEPQLLIKKPNGNIAAPNILFQDLGFRSSGTVLDIYTDSINAYNFTWALDTLYIIIKDSIGVENITKLY